jgi:predicted nuclease of predicted toxin-antitoxin system
MNIREFRFLADENIDKELVLLLREDGLDVFDIKEEGLFQLSDLAILEISYTEKRIVITQDSDFGKLIFRDSVSFYGIIYLRPGHHSSILHVQTMNAILQSDIEFRIPFILVAENIESVIRMRLRNA